jgi:prolipoprotein diacylglyceryltransferase
LSMAIGRLGNFLAGDAYGTPTSLPCSIYQADAYWHPVQLYELALAWYCLPSSGAGGIAPLVTDSHSGCT